SGSATITFKAWDASAGSNGATAVDTTTDGGTTAFSTATDTASITVNDVNDAPVLTADTPSLTGITENETSNTGDLVSDIVGANISDVDSGASEGIAITAVTGNSSWEYSTDAGTNWTAVGTVAADIALLLRSVDKVRYVPDAENAEAATFTFIAWDQTSGSEGTKVDASSAGGITAFSSISDTADITVTAVNDTPSDIAISSATVNENVSVGATIGTFSSVDVDTGDSHTYTLVSGTGDTNNSSFTITGSTLKTNALLNFEAKSSYSIRVQTDDGAATYAEAITITITDVNEAPTDISLSSSTVDENVSVGTTVGTLSTTDVDSGDSHTYTLVSGTGDTDNASFSLTGSTLKTNGALDFETKSSYSVRIQTSDGSLTTAEAITISVNDVNEAPTDISLDATTIEETATIGTTIGNFSATDPDTGDTHTYTLVSGTGDTDNASFAIVGGALTTDAEFDFETQSIFSIRAQVSDGTETYQEAFVITISDVNDAPTATNLTQTLSYNEDDASVAIDDIVVTENDSGDTITATLTLANSGAGGDLTTTGGGAYTDGTGVWTITDTVANVNTALAAVAFEPEANFATNTTISVNITDGEAAALTGTITLNVTPVNDAPVLTAAGPSFAGITEDVGAGEEMLVSTLVGDNLADNDAGAVEGIVISATTGNGTWQYSIDDGANWSDVGVVAQSSALALRSTDKVRYIPDGENSETAGFEFRAWDQTSGTEGAKLDATTTGSTSAFSVDTDNTTIVVAAVNDAPVLTGAMPDLTGITEDDLTNTGELVSDIVDDSISDVDSGALEGIVITDVTGNGSWQYSIDDGTNWSEVGTVAENSALALGGADKVRYVPDGENAETPTFTFRAWDQTSQTAGTKIDASTTGDTTAYSLVSDTASLAVTAVNDAPVIDLNGDAAGVDFAGAFTENGGTVAIVDVSGLTVSDVDNAMIESVTVTITDMQNTGDEILAMLESSYAEAEALGISSFYDSATGIFSLSGSNTLANYQALLSSTTYNNLNENPSGTSRAITFTVNDGIANSNVATSAIAINGVNDAPVFTVPGSTQNVNEGEDLVFSTVSVGDDDAGTNDVLVTLTADNGLLTLAQTSGLSFTAGNGASDDTMTFTGTLTNINTALNGLIYRSIAYFEGTDTITFTVDDQGNSGTGGTLTDTETVDVDVTAAIVTYVDLTGEFDSVELPDPARTGDSGLARINLTNAGDTTASGSLDIQVWASADGDLDAGDDDFLLGARADQSINLGQDQSRIYAVNLTLPANIPAGNYDLIAIVDANNDFAERDEWNNTDLQQDGLTVEDPDLTGTISSVTASDPIVGGERATVTVEVVNDGNVKAEGDIDISYYLSTDATFDGGDALIDQLTENTISLNPDQTKSFSADLTLPEVQATGDYYVLAVIDSGDDVTESNEANNIAAGTILTIEQAHIDLSGVFGTWDSADVIGGDSVEVTVDVTNNGNIDAEGQMDISYYLSTDTVLDGGDVLLAESVDQTVSLNPDGSQTYSTDVTLPMNMATANYYVLADIDSADSLDESNENNNLAAAEPLLITEGSYDLTGEFTSVKTPDPAMGGDLAKVVLTVTNEGNVRIDDTMDIGFYLSTDAILDGGDVLITELTDQNVALNPAGSTNYSTKLSLPLSMPTADYYLLADIDTNDSVAETDEANNLAAGDTVTIEEATIDLSGTVDTITVDDLLLGGDSVNVTVNVTNHGNVKATGLMDISYYLSTDGVLDGGDTLLTVSADQKVALNPDIIKAYRTKVVIPTGIPTADYFLLADIDSGDALTEDDEANNVASSNSITVTEAYVDLTGDLSLSNVPDSVRGGEKLKLAVEVTNQGNAQATGAMDIQLWASADGNITAGDDDYLLQTLDDQNLNLPANDSQTYNLNVTMPSNLPADVYDFIAVVDADENNESNNTSTVADGLTVENSDMSVILDKVKMPSTLTAGAKGSARLNVLNQSQIETNGAATMKLWLTSDGDITDAIGDYELTSMYKKVKIKTGAVKKFNMKFNLPENIDPGDYWLLGEADSNNDIAESNEDNNTYMNGTQYQADETAYSFGDLGQNKPVKFTFNNEDNPVTITLKGSGRGLIVNDDGIDTILLDGTDSDTVLKINSKYPITVGSIGDATPGSGIEPDLKKIVAKKTSLLGDVLLNSLSILRVNDIQDGVTIRTLEDIRNGTDIFAKEVGQVVFDLAGGNHY
ncbi:MAG: hypothetical protein GY869_30010, partial [Planctomycetes bacterium]|nr:hypothetical protein [Planctomycetota bacterium]